MSINLNNNLISSICARSLFNSTISLNTTMQRLSTGLRINSAADNAANLSLSKNLDTKISGLNVANNNIQTSSSQLQTFSSYLGNMASSLQKVRDLAVQASNGVYSNAERKMINDNAQELLKGVDQATNQANTEIKAKTVNTVGFVDVVNKVTTGYDTAHTINTAAEFVSKITGHLSESFILANDIDMSELGTLSDSVITGLFQGQFDGNGYSIKNLSINTVVANNIGLFSQIDGAAAVLKNVALENANIQASNTNYVGGLVGYSTAGSTTTNCYSTGTVNGRNYTGGLVGRTSASSVTNSYSAANVICGSMGAGGLVGYAMGSITNCYSTGSITGGGNYTGGLLGEGGSVVIQNSYSTGAVSGSSAVGGLVGGYVGAGNIINNCYATGTVSGSSGVGRVGGLVGFANNITVTNSYATGSASSTGTYVGGLIGYKHRGSLSNSYATGSANGTTSIGGLIGYNTGGTAINNCYATGAANGSGPVGGFIGSNLTATITNSYATGAVTSSGSAGGFAGLNTGTIDATNFWDTEKSGQSSSAGGTGLTSAQIDAGQGTTGWDSTLWNLTCGKPELAWDENQNIMSVKINEQTNSTSKYAMKYLGLDFNIAGGLNVDLSTANGAQSAISTIDKAIEYLSGKQAVLGASLNALSGMINSNSKKHNNLVDATSVLRDTDMAVESAKMTQQKIKQSMTASILQQSKIINSNSVYQLLNL